MRRPLTFALGLCLATAAAISAPAFAGAEEVDAVFFSEFSASSYTIDQGEIVTFANRDPYAAHGVNSDDEAGGSPLFSAPVLAPKHVSLLRGAPFLTTGTYNFHCPVHPEMTSTLEVTASGTPLPPDSTPPTAVLKVRTGRIAGLLKKRRLRFSVNPAEIADLSIVARAGGVLVGELERTYLSLGRRGIVVKVPRQTVAAIRERIAELKAKHRRFLKVVVSASLTDVAGNAAVSRGLRRLRIPLPPPPPPPKDSKKG